MNEVTVIQINGIHAYGKDEDGVVIRLVKCSRVPDLKAGDVVAGHYLNEDDDPDNFFFEVSHKS